MAAPRHPQKPADAPWRACLLAKTLTDKPRPLSPAPLWFRAVLCFKVSLYAVRAAVRTW
ncbi:hypothetical protein P3K25_005621 [Escherichia coli]|nr:hypothetical protein [Escherichia coli]